MIEKKECVNCGSNVMVINCHYSCDNFGLDNVKWFYRMLNSKKPFQEKMTLFWHHVFATGWTKSEQGPSIIDHIAMLRKNCLSNLRVLLSELSADPA